MRRFDRGCHTLAYPCSNALGTKAESSLLASRFRSQAWEGRNPCSPARKTCQMMTDAGGTFPEPPVLGPLNKSKTNRHRTLSPQFTACKNPVNLVRGTFGAAGNMFFSEQWASVSQGCVVCEQRHSQQTCLSSSRNECVRCRWLSI